MVFTQRIHLNVLHNHHLVVVHIKERGSQYLEWVFLVSLRQEFERPLHAFRCAFQPIAFRVFADPHQQLTQQFFGA